jgi:hypothetical protein
VPAPHAPRAGTTAPRGCRSSCPGLRELAAELREHRGRLRAARLLRPACRSSRDGHNRAVHERTGRCCRTPRHTFRRSTGCSGGGSGHGCSDDPRGSPCAGRSRDALSSSAPRGSPRAGRSRDALRSSAPRGSARAGCGCDNSGGTPDRSARGRSRVSRSSVLRARRVHAQRVLRLLYRGTSQAGPGPIARRSGRGPGEERERADDRGARGRSAVGARGAGPAARRRRRGHDNARRARLVPPADPEPSHLPRATVALSRGTKKRRALRPAVLSSAEPCLRTAP